MNASCHHPMIMNHRHRHLNLLRRPVRENGNAPTSGPLHVRALRPTIQFHPLARKASCLTP